MMRLVPKAVFIAASSAALLATAQAQQGRVLATGGELTSREFYENIPQAPARSVSTRATVDLSPFFPPPGDQGRQGSCVAWALAYAARTFVAEVQGSSLWDQSAPTGQFSPAFMYNSIQNALHGSCDGSNGSSVFDGLLFLKERGAVTLDSFPYSDRSCSELPNRRLNAQAAAFRINGFEILGERFEVDMERVIDQIEAGRPVIVTAHVGADFRNHAGPGLASNANPIAYHAMVVVGFSRDRSAFKLLNSWGRSWGDGGYGWVSFDMARAMFAEAYVLSDSAAVPLPGDEALREERLRAYDRLMLAAYENDLEGLREGLGAGLRGDVAYSGDTALETAVDRGHVEAARLILESGASPNVAVNVHGNLLNLAYGNRDRDMVRLLLGAGINVNLLASDGYSTMCGAAPRDGEIYHDLVRAGARCIRPSIRFAEAR